MYAPGLARPPLGKEGNIGPSGRQAPLRFTHFVFHVNLNAPKIAEIIIPFPLRFRPFELTMKPSTQINTQGSEGYRFNAASPKKTLGGECLKKVVFFF